MFFLKSAKGGQKSSNSTGAGLVEYSILLFTVLSLCINPMLSTGEHSAARFEQLAIAMGGGTEGSMDEDASVGWLGCPEGYHWNELQQKCVSDEEVM